MSLWKRKIFYRIWKYQIQIKIQTCLFIILFFRSAIFRIFKVLKVALIRAKTPTFSTNIVGAGFTQLLKKAKIFLEEELDVDSTDDVSLFFILAQTNSSGLNNLKSSREASNRQWYKTAYNLQFIQLSTKQIRKIEKKGSCPRTLKSSF